MTLIEGLGDEVTLVFVLLTLILVAVIAWVSTHTRDIPFISVIVVELSRRSEQDRRLGNANTDDQSSTPNDTNTPGGEDVTESNQNAATEGECFRKTSEAVNVTTNAVGDADQAGAGNGSGATVVGSRPVTGLLSTQDDERSNGEGLNAVSEMVHSIGDSASVLGRPESDDSLVGISVAEDVASHTTASHTTALDALASETTRQNDTTVLDFARDDTSGCHTTVSDSIRCHITEHNTTGSDSNAIDNTTVLDTIIPSATEQDMKSELRQRRLAFFDGSKHDSSSQNEDFKSLRMSRQSQDSTPSNSVAASETLQSSPSNTNAATGLEAAAAAAERSSPSPRGTGQGQGEYGSADVDNLGEHSTSDLSSHDASGSGNDAGGSLDDASGSRNDASTNDADETGSEIRVRLKYLNDTQRLVYTRPSQTVQEFRRTHFASELANNKLVRFIFNGQDLRNDGYTLQSYNIVDNSVVHCLVTQMQQSPSNVPNNDLDLDFDLGHLMLPLFGFILAVIWYLRFTYRQYFNAMSTLCLVGVTFLFFLGVVSSYNGHRRRVHVE